jgi:hypothetical protein
VFRYRSAQHSIDVFKAYYGPIHKTFGALPAHGQTALLADIMSLIARLNTARDGTMVVPGEYLEAVVVKQ